MANLMLAGATPPLNTDNSVGFFTNVASRLLLSELNLDLTRIQIYPTNQYTPAVHRLLQVTANVYDATTTNLYPSVFRPLFSRDADGLGTNVFISGYMLQTNLITEGSETDSVVTPDLALPINTSDLAAAGGQVINLATNVYGIPWIIGAKKGFPNFNEFSLESAFQITRKLQYMRNTNTWQYASNQMYIMSITNFYGVECWNSYSNSYPRTGSGPVAILARANMGINLTNDAPFFVPVTRTFQASTIVLINSWPGYGTVGSSFLLPFSTNAYVLWLTNSVYNYGPNTMPPFTPPGFIPASMNGSNYLNNGTPPLPHFGLLTTNRLQLAIIDYSAGPNNGRIIDYVQLNGMDSSRDLNAEIADPDDYGLWSANITNDSPLGVFNQVHYSRYGSPPLSVEDSGDGGGWSTASIPGLPFATPAADQFYFNRFFAHSLTTTYVDPNTLKLYTLTYTATNLLAPYTTTRTRVQRLTWQANDPLVHYLASDLTDTFADANAQHVITWPDNLGLLNDRYMPWGGHQPINLNYPDFNTVNAYNLTIKDPLVFSSDSWDFPTNESLAGDWLGRVHRGTPWQTIYLKSSDILGESQNGVNIGANTWMNWTGDLDANDAANMAPVRDWHLASLLASMFNTNDFRSLFSVNNPNPDAWRVLLDGLTVLTNATPNTLLVISSNSPQASAIAMAIQSARPGQFFRDVGDILATPQLTEQSPFLNWSSSVQQEIGISDEAYEMIPSQLLSLLRADSIGSIVPVNGQPLVQFSGYDGHAYAIEVSSDLINWVSISTNCPVNGTFNFMISAPFNASQQFYRSVLLQ
jgi:hypothetical protein